MSINRFPELSDESRDRLAKSLTFNEWAIIGGRDCHLGSLFLGSVRRDWCLS